ncbi:MAG: radical SAM protein (TIGR01212 family) [Planctomycetota bacterium]|jgi:radical SAM protein (TIGR01212 family)
MDSTASPHTPDTGATRPPAGAPTRFRTLRPWLKQTFGRPVHRIALDAGSTCPNRDGTRGHGGCIYCDVEGSGTGALADGDDLQGQLQVGLKRVARRDMDGGVIAYFQSYSNTYVEPERLDDVLRIVEPQLVDVGGPILCVAVATRPDTLPDWSLERLAKLAQRVPVWVELGLEAADDQILEDIRRMHTVSEFQEAVVRCHEFGLETVGHAILGLPGDGRDGARRTAEVLAAAGCRGIKVHHLMILKRTVLAHWYHQGRVEVLTPEVYLEWLADFVERLAPDQILHRITGDSPSEDLIAPRWPIHKNWVREQLDRTLAARGTCQGSLQS